MISRLGSVYYPKGLLTYIVILLALRLYAGEAFIPPDKMTTGRSQDDQFFYSESEQSPNGYLTITIEGFQDREVGTMGFDKRFPRIGIHIISTPNNDLSQAVFGVAADKAVTVDVTADGNNPGATDLRGTALQKIALPCNFTNPFHIDVALSSIDSGEPSLVQQGLGVALDLASLAGGLTGGQVSAGVITARPLVATAESDFDKVMKIIHGDGNKFDSNTSFVPLKGPIVNGGEIPDNILRPGGLLFYNSKLDQWIMDHGLQGQSFSWDPHQPIKRRLKVGTSHYIPADPDYCYVLLRLEYTDSIIYDGDKTLYYHDTLLPVVGKGSELLTIDPLIHDLETNESYVGGTWFDLVATKTKLLKIQEQITKIQNWAGDKEILTKFDKAKIVEFATRKINAAIDSALNDITGSPIRTIADLKGFITDKNAKGYLDQVAAAKDIIRMPLIKESYKRPDSCWKQFADAIVPVIP